MYASFKNIYFVGIGGIGMSALARWFKAKNYFVAGYDRTPTSLTYEIQKEGIEIHFEDNIGLIPQNLLQEKEETLIVYTPAIPEEHKELNFFFKENYLVEKRAKVLGNLTKDFFTIAIAGTHGKTSTSSMIGHLLKFAGLPCTAFLGGILQDYQSNLLLNESEEKDIMVVEADEFDRSFLQLYPDWGVILSTDADHLDIYNQKESVEEAYLDFAKQIPEDGKLFLQKEVNLSFQKEKLTSNLCSFALNEKADFSAKNIRIENASFIFDFYSANGNIPDISLKVPGFHNVSNATVAIAIAQGMGVSAEKIKDALKNYRGVQRRFEYVIDSPNLVMIDDYAHHPTELSALLESVRALYPERKVSIIFQPHLYSRTRDFVEEFAKSLSKADEVILLDIYPARELPIKGVSSEIIFEKLTCQEKSLQNKKDLLNYIKNKAFEVLVTAGAGNIAQEVMPIKNFLEDTYSKKYL